MENWFALFRAIGGNAVTLWSGIFGLMATFLGLLSRKTPYGKYFFAAGIAALVLSPALAWIDEHKLRLQLETVRPYVVIEELTSAQIRAMSLKDPRNPVLPEGAYDRGYVTGLSTSGQEILFYNVRNTETLTARNVTLYNKITTIGDEPAQTIAALPPENKRTVLIPGQFITRSVVVPRGTFFTGLPNEKRKLRVELVLTFSGQLSDKNTYFYKIVLRAQRYTDLAHMNRVAMGLQAESTDEGIVKDAQHLNELIN